MTETIKVQFSGPAFSFLMYENARHPSDQEGFLIGQFFESKRQNITDNDMPSVTEEKVVIVNSILPCPDMQYFYSNSGTIDASKIVKLLHSETKKVVGWFKTKNGFGINGKLTLREKIIHKQLANSFEIPSDMFVICLLSSSSNYAKSTHSNKQLFIRYNMPIFERIPMHIANLSDPNTSYIHSIPSSETFKTIFASLQINTKNTKGLDAITKIQYAVQTHTDNVVQQLSKAEKMLFQLENEVSEMQERNQRLLDEKKNTKPTQNGSEEMSSL